MARAYNDSGIVVLAVLWHFVLLHSMPVRGTAPRWTKEAANEVERQFNLYTESNGQEGWDPRDRNASYIKPLAQKNNVLWPFLAVNLGGHESHKDSAKILQGYEWVASEYFVKLAKWGVRHSTFIFVHCFYLILASYTCCASFIFFTTTEKYLKDEGLTGKWRKSSENEVSLEEDDEDADDADDAADNDAKDMPAKTTPKERTPAKTTPKERIPAKTTPKRTPEPPQTVDAPDVDALAAEVRQSLNLKIWTCEYLVLYLINMMSIPHIYIIIISYLHSQTM